jgi:hypothetical protein
MCKMSSRNSISIIGSTSRISCYGLALGIHPITAKLNPHMHKHMHLLNLINKYEILELHVF